MKNKLIITSVITTVLAGGLIAFANNQVIQFDPKLQPKQNTTIKETPIATTKKQEQMPPANADEYALVTSLNVVANPDKYLNKKIKFKASFDKFSTLGLDYKPAFRDSQKYISFLIKRDDITDHTVPLSEMKIFITRTEAEKFIELDSGDIIEIYGKVFSNALTDSWIDVDKLIVLEKKNKEEKKKAE